MPSVTKKNRLDIVRPDIASQWHPTRNENLNPSNISVNSGKKVWWLYPYDDPKTGKHFDFEWCTSVGNRTQGQRCPYLIGKAVWPGFNDLATTNPELAAQWHPTKNGVLKPFDVTAGSGKKVWWLLSYNDPKTSKHFNFEWQAKIYHRVSGAGCPYLVGQAVWPGFNDLATTNPELVKEWHPTKNGDLTPQNITAGYEKNVWWIYSYDDPTTGKHFDFEWLAKTAHRAHGIGCPYLSGQAVWPGFNDLATTNPELAAQWHPVKNGTLKPFDVTIGSRRKVWWFLPYHDPRTGKYFEFEWRAFIYSRKRTECPYLNNQALWPGFNDLATVNPGLAKEWHPTQNGDLTPSDILYGSKQRVWWLFPYDDPKTGRHFNFEWRASVVDRHYRRDGCPYLSGHAVWPGFNDLATVNPELAKEWHPTKNGDLTPSHVTCYSKQKVWWQASVYDLNTDKYISYDWRASIGHRAAGCGCPYLSSSNGERMIGQWLRNNKINFKYQKTFDDLYGLGKGKLSYDFFIPQYTMLIEYQGEQHYEVVEYFGGKTKFQQQQKHDALKRRYAKDHGYALIEIPYIVDTQEKINDFMEKHVRPLLTNKSQASA